MRDLTRVLTAWMAVGAILMVAVSSDVRAVVPTASQWATPLELDFGPVGVGNTAQLLVAITNNGLTNITGWAGGGVGAPLNGSQDCNIPGGVLPGSSCHFHYTFTPTAVGSFSATSTFSTNAGTTSIKLQGQGVPVFDIYVPFVSR
jgi:hypothetical protein